MTSRFTWQLAALSSVCLALSACGGGGGGGTAASTGGGGSAQANQMFTWVSNANDSAQWQAFADAAKKKDPTFNLTFTGPAFNDYWTKVKTRMSAADAPCLLTTQAARAQELKGVLTPLGDLIKENKVDTSIYNAAMLKGMTVDGQIVALPYDAEPDVLYYNKAMFKKAGLTAPGTSYTITQFLADAKKLTAAPVYGIAMKPSLMESTPGGFGYSFGGEVTSNGNTTIADGDFVKGVQQAFDLSAKEKVALPPSSGDADGVAQGAFTSAKAAMIIEGPWMYSAFAKSLGADLGVAVIPSPSGKPIGVIQGSGFGISAKCPDKAAAFKNLMKLVDPDVIGAVAAAHGTVPSVDAQVGQWAAGKPAESVAAVRALLDGGKPLVTPPTWNQINTQFLQFSPEGFRGTKTAQDILTTIVKSAN